MSVWIIGIDYSERDLLSRCPHDKIKIHWSLFLIFVQNFNQKSK